MFICSYVVDLGTIGQNDMLAVYFIVQYLTVQCFTINVQCRLSHGSIEPRTPNS